MDANFRGFGSVMLGHLLSQVWEPSHPLFQDSVSKLEQRGWTPQRLLTWDGDATDFLFLPASHRITLTTRLPALSRQQQRSLNDSFEFDLESLPSFANYTHVTEWQVRDYLPKAVRSGLVSTLRDFDLSEAHAKAIVLADPTIPYDEAFMVTYYTSGYELLGRPEPFYKFVNRTLRERAYELEELPSIMYLIESRLYNIQSQSVTAFRGLNTLSQLPKWIIGNQLCFSTITSASLNRDKAIQFAAKPPQLGEPHIPVLLEMIFQDAKDINRYSLFPQEQEVVASFCSRWEITGDRMENVVVKNQPLNLRVFTLAQLPSSRIFPSTQPRTGINWFLHVSLPNLHLDNGSYSRELILHTFFTRLDPAVKQIMQNTRASFLDHNFHLNHPHILLSLMLKMKVRLEALQQCFDKTGIGEEGFQILLRNFNFFSVKELTLLEPVSLAALGFNPVQIGLIKAYKEREEYVQQLVSRLGKLENLAISIQAYEWSIVEISRIGFGFVTRRIWQHEISLPGALGQVNFFQMSLALYTLTIVSTVSLNLLKLWCGVISLTRFFKDTCADLVGIFSGVVAATYFGYICAHVGALVGGPVGALICGCLGSIAGGLTGPLVTSAVKQFFFPETEEEKEKTMQAFLPEALHLLDCHQSDSDISILRTYQSHIKDLDNNSSQKLIYDLAYSIVREYRYMFRASLSTLVLSLNTTEQEFSDRWRDIQPSLVLIQQADQEVYDDHMKAHKFLEIHFKGHAFSKCRQILGGL